MDVFPVDWLARDVEDDERARYTITVFGKTPDGKSAAIHVRFSPYFFVRLPDSYDPGRARLFVSEACTRHGAMPSMSRVLERVTMWGFTAGTKMRLALLAFDSRRAMSAAARAYQKNHDTFESTIDPLLRFFHVRNIRPAHWIHVPHWTDVRDKTTRAEVEVACGFEVVAPSDLYTTPPLIVASFDLECYSPDRKFPRSEISTNAVIQIATSFKRFGETEPFRTVVLALHDTDGVHNAEVTCFDSEPDMIQAWLDLIAEEETDIIVSYNGNSFDWPYLYGRSLVCVDDATGDSLVDLGTLGRMTEGGGVPRHQLVNASGGGSSFTLAAPGVLVIDLLQILKKSMNLEKYALGAVSAKFLDGQSKLDLLPGEIFSCFEGTPADRARIAEYAAMDVILPLLLMDKLCTLLTLFAMANVTKLPTSAVVERGQQVRVYSPLMDTARKMGFVCPDNKGIPPTGKYEGATVLDPVVGAHYHPIAILDFESLYPSIIRGWGLDYTTLVLDPKYDNVEGVEYHEVQTDQGTFRFAQGVKGVLPTMLEELAASRKAAKADMARAAREGNSLMQATYNSQQLAYKLVMNTAYGLMGAVKGFLPCVPIAASITATGRLMIMKTKRLVEELCPGSEVVYGDSVAGYTPCIVRIAGEVRVSTFETLADAYGQGVWLPMDHPGKESCELHGVDVWSDDGWTPMHRVIRHRAGKPMVRVVTHTGVVDVTEDHSLLRDDGTPVSPRDLTVGDTLLHATLPRLGESSSHMSEAEARVRGFFFGDGFADVYSCPSDVLGASEEVRKAFWYGMYDACGDKDSNGCMRIDLKSQVSAACIFLLAESLGYKASVNTRVDKPDIYRVSASLGAQRKIPVAIKKMHPIEWDDTQYVYDVTTSNHHFQAGVGRMVVHNTDSVMVKLHVADASDMTAYFETAERVAAQISKTFPTPVRLEFEKVLYPYVLMGKKRYAAIEYTSPEKANGIYMKGLQTVRHDSSPIVKTTMEAVLNRILEARAASEAVGRAMDVARDAVLRILRKEVAVEEYATSKKLKAKEEYKNAAQPHVVVADRVHERTGFAPPIGARVDFVYLYDRAQPKLAFRAEDPAYAAEQNLPIDCMHYLNLVMSAVVPILEVVVGPEAETVLMSHAAVQEAMRRYTNSLNNQRPITDFFIKKPRLM